MKKRILGGEGGKLSNRYNITDYEDAWLSVKTAEKNRRKTERNVTTLTGFQLHIYPPVTHRYSQGIFILLYGILDRFQYLFSSFSHNLWCTLRNFSNINILSRYFHIFIYIFFSLFPDKDELFYFDPEFRAYRVRKNMEETGIKTLLKIDLN